MKISFLSHVLLRKFLPCCPQRTPLGMSNLLALTLFHTLHIVARRNHRNYVSAGRQQGGKQERNSHDRVQQMAVLEISSMVLPYWRSFSVLKSELWKNNWSTTEILFKIDNRKVSGSVIMPINPSNFGRFKSTIMHTCYFEKCFI